MIEKQFVRCGLFLLLLGFSWGMFGQHCWGLQMEKRTLNLYDLKGFETQSPQVGSTAPELQLTNLAGEPLRLSDYQDKTVVLIKAGYT